MNWADISDAIVALSGIVVAIVAALGLGQWYAELKGKARFESARKLGFLALQFEDQFRSITVNPIYPRECEGRQKSKDESPEEHIKLNERFARLERLKLTQETLRELRKAGWEAEMILRENFRDYIKPFEDAFLKLEGMMHLHWYREDQDSQHFSGLSKEAHDSRNKLHATVYGADRELPQSVQSAAERLTKYLKRHVK